MTTKQRAFLKGLAMNIDPIYQIGKSSITPEFTTGISEALEARDLIKISVLKNCADDPGKRRKKKINGRAALWKELELWEEPLIRFIYHI